MNQIRRTDLTPIQWEAIEALLEDPLGEPLPDDAVFDDVFDDEYEAYEA